MWSDKPSGHAYCALPDALPGLQVRGKWLWLLSLHLTPRRLRLTKMKRPLNLQSQDSDLTLKAGCFPLGFAAISKVPPHCIPETINSGITNLTGTVHGDLSVFAPLFVLHSSYCLLSSDLPCTMSYKKPALCNMIY